MSSGPALGPAPGQQYQNQNQYQYQYPTQPLRTQQPDTRRPSIPGSSAGNLPPRETSLSQSQSQPLSQGLSSSPGSSASPIATAPPSNLSGFPRRSRNRTQLHEKLADGFENWIYMISRVVSSDCITHLVVNVCLNDAGVSEDIEHKSKSDLLYSARS